jgi:hypothetical protein
MAMSAAMEKSYESKIADLIRRFGTDFEGEVIAIWSALKRLLGSRNVTFTDLGDAVEKLATGGLEEAQMKRVYDAGYAKGVEDTERKHAEAQAALGFHADGSTDWEAIALYCQQRKAHIETKHHQFVDDMASRMSWGRGPSSEKQGKYLLSLFRGIGGRVK